MVIAMSACVQYGNCNECIARKCMMFLTSVATPLICPCNIPYTRWVIAHLFLALQLNMIYFVPFFHCVIPHAGDNISSTQNTTTPSISDGTVEVYNTVRIFTCNHVILSSIYCTAKVSL